ncbi:MAG: PEP-CTERM sorting domain-containing protein [Verrucomicrobia bacterium]|nr:PEP-CTERM sorting domain-containing protein [Verrucomicrobiota bacterium]
MKPCGLALALGLLSAFSLTQARATAIVTYIENPGVVTSSIVHAPSYTFDTLPTGVQSNVAWDGVGTFDQLNILNADQFGGAANTRYAVEGLASVSQTILNLNSPSSYFGMWWSAGDTSNTLDFYSGANGTGTLLAEFATADLLKGLPYAYHGNPNAGALYQTDLSEPFAFINFFGTAETTWSSMVFRNAPGSGFEGDNYTSRVKAYDALVDGALPAFLIEAIKGGHEIPLAQVPEPNAAYAMLLLGGLSAGGTLFRRFKKA